MLPNTTDVIASILQLEQITIRNLGSIKEYDTHLARNPILLDVVEYRFWDHIAKSFGEDLLLDFGIFGVFACVYVGSQGNVRELSPIVGEEVDQECSVAATASDSMDPSPLVLLLLALNLALIVLCIISTDLRRPTLPRSLARTRFLRPVFLLLELALKFFDPTLLRNARHLEVTRSLNTSKSESM
jgi:hypothetical protein